jgi:hypothetical protein
LKPLRLTLKFESRSCPRRVRSDEADLEGEQGKSIGAGHPVGRRIHRVGRVGDQSAAVLPTCVRFSSVGMPNSGYSERIPSVLRIPNALLVRKRIDGSLTRRLRSATSPAALSFCSLFFAASGLSSK